MSLYSNEVNEKKNTLSPTLKNQINNIQRASLESVAEKTLTYKYTRLLKFVTSVINKNIHMF